MVMNFGEKLKALRKEKGISQEKLAQYLNISFQAVSKWENANTYPDITLLPKIARFFGITVDELLQVEQIDEEKVYADYEKRAMDLYRCGRVADTIPLWQEACHNMPNNVAAKEMLMSSYFDTDAKKYQKEIVEIGQEILLTACDTYYKGQATEQLARTYAECGDLVMAKKYVRRAYRLMHSQEMLLMNITDDGEEMLSTFSYANYWYLNKLFYMAARLSGCEGVPGGAAYTQSVDKAVAALYELVFPDDDMGFEDLKDLCMQHRSIAEDEISLGNDESVVRHHLTRAFECAEKSVGVKEHKLKHPLVMGWQVYDAPSDNKQVLQLLKSELAWDCFNEYRSAKWFKDIEAKLSGMLA